MNLLRMGGRGRGLLGEVSWGAREGLGLEVVVEVGLELMVEERGWEFIIFLLASSRSSSTLSVSSLLLLPLPTFIFIFTARPSLPPPLFSSSLAFLLLSLLFHLSISSLPTTHSLPKIPISGSFNPRHSSHHFLSTSVLPTIPIFTICNCGTCMYESTIPRIRTTLHSEMSSQGIWGVEMEGLLEGLLGGAWGVSGDGSGRSATHSMHAPLESSIV